MSRMRFAYADYSFAMTSFSINELASPKPVKFTVFRAAKMSRQRVCHAWWWVVMGLTEGVGCGWHRGTSDGP